MSAQSCSTPQRPHNHVPAVKRDALLCSRRLMNARASLVLATWGQAQEGKKLADSENSSNLATVAKGRLRRSGLRELSNTASHYIRQRHVGLCGKGFNQRWIN